jgi:ribokinase
VFEVVGLGCCCFDLLGVAPHIPTIDEEIAVLQSSQQGGGKAATAVVALARLGHKAAFIGKIGDDPIGAIIRSGFESTGVDASMLVVEPGATSHASVVLVDKDTGKRTIVSLPPTFADMTSTDLPACFLDNTQALHLDGVHRPAALEAAQRARTAGIPVVIDADLISLDDEIHELITLCDVAIASEPFASRFSESDRVEDGLAKLRSLGPKVVGVTMGDKGSSWIAEGRSFHTPVFEIDVVDTTGAGDVFHGAYISGMLRGWSCEKCAEFASAVAAIKCTRIGGRAGIPTIDETLRFLQGRDTVHFR